MTSIAFNLLCFNRDHFGLDLGSNSNGNILEITDRQLLFPGFVEYTGMFIGFRSMSSSAEDTTFFYTLKDTVFK